MAAAGPDVGMVLAAGLGKRMRPFTETTPKPLVKVAGRTLIDWALDRLEAAGAKRVIVNIHHHRAQMEAHLRARGRPTIVPSPEANLLETGGGIVNALLLLGDRPFYVANADNLWLDGRTPALSRLARLWDEQTMDALLLLQASVSARGYDGAGDYFCDSLGRLRYRQHHEIAPFVYAGVHIAHPRLFDGAPKGAFSLKLLWDRAEAAGRLWGVVHDGLWFHVGSPEGLAIAEAELGAGPHSTAP